MPGVAFFQTKSPDSPELRELVRACDRLLSAEFWPDGGASQIIGFKSGFFGDAGKHSWAKLLAVME
jgi:hypothetical protein